MKLDNIRAAEAQAAGADLRPHSDSVCSGRGRASLRRKRHSLSRLFERDWRECAGLRPSQSGSGHRHAEPHAAAYLQPVLPPGSGRTGDAVDGDDGPGSRLFLQQRHRGLGGCAEAGACPCWPAAGKRKKDWDENSGAGAWAFMAGRWVPFRTSIIARAATIRYGSPAESA